MIEVIGGVFAFCFIIAFYAGIILTIREIIKKRNKSKHNGIIEIESGKHLTIPVYGEHYAQGARQVALKEMLTFRENRFSLTCQSPYQKEQGWPEMPFVNVNIKGSKSTTKDNWLGYIAPLAPFDKEDDTPERKERRKYIRKLIKLCENNAVTISGKIIDERKKKGSYQLLLFASRKSIDAAYKKYVGKS